MEPHPLGGTVGSGAVQRLRLATLHLQCDEGWGGGVDPLTWMGEDHWVGPQEVPGLQETRINPCLGSCCCLVSVPHGGRIQGAAPGTSTGVGATWTHITDTQFIVTNTQYAIT